MIQVSVVRSGGGKIHQLKPVLNTNKLEHHLSLVIANFKLLLLATNWWCSVRGQHFHVRHYLASFNFAQLGPVDLLHCCTIDNDSAPVYCRNRPLKRGIGSLLVSCSPNFITIEQNFIIRAQLFAIHFG